MGIVDCEIWQMRRAENSRWWQHTPAEQFHCHAGIHLIGEMQADASEEKRRKEQVARSHIARGEERFNLKSKKRRIATNQTKYFDFGIASNFLPMSSEL
jgi:hypothetical protein